MTSALLPLPEAAAIEPLESRYFITMSGQRFAFIAGGSHVALHQGNSQASIEVDPDFISLTVDDAKDKALDVMFGAPEGEVLEERPYRWARSSLNSSYPFFDVSYAGRGCNTRLARFDIKELAFSPDGDVARLWLIFEQHCGTTDPATFGEIRIGLRPSSLLGPRAVHVPAGESVSRSTEFGLHFAAQETVTVQRVRVAGRDPDDFPIEDDACSGRTLAPNEMCEVRLKADYGPPGRRNATLIVESTTGEVLRQTYLRSRTIEGRSRVILEGEAGEWVTNGRTWTYDARSALIGADLYYSGVRGGVRSYDGDWWHFVFAPPRGENLVEGRTYRGIRFPWHQGDQAGLEIAGEGRGCNELVGRFTVKELEHAHDVVQRVRFVFAQRCVGEEHWLYGLFDYRMRSRPPDASL